MPSKPATPTGLSTVRGTHSVRLACQIKYAYGSSPSFNGLMIGKFSAQQAQSAVACIRQYRFGGEPEFYDLDVLISA